MRVFTRSCAVVAPARQADRELDALGAARHGGDVGRVLLGGEDLLEQGRQLHLAEHAARLHVGQHAAQRTDIARQQLHLAQALVHLLEPLGHLPEALAQALLERGVQLLVDRGTHLLELALVALLQCAEPPFVGLRQCRQLRAQAVGQPAQGGVLRIARRLALLRQGVRRGLQGVAHLLLHRRQLHTKRVHLLVLRARQVAALREQRLLEQRQAGGKQETVAEGFERGGCISVGRSLCLASCPGASARAGAGYVRA